MTSRENNNQTVEFFEENNYFNYPKEAIKFFIQGELPMLDTEGKSLVNEEGLIKEAADGHCRGRIWSDGRHCHDGGYLRGDRG